MKTKEDVFTEVLKDIGWDLVHALDNHKITLAEYDRVAPYIGTNYETLKTYREVDLFLQLLVEQYPKVFMDSFLKNHEALCLLAERLG